MSGFFSPSGGTPTPTPNPDITYERLGYQANGSMVTVTAGGGNHTKGSYATIGTTASAWGGFYLDIGVASAAAARFLLDIRAGGSTIILPDWFIKPSNASATSFFIPLAVAASTLIEIRCQAGSAGQSFTAALNGVVSSSSLAPGFGQATALNADTTNTRPSTINVPMQSSLTTWTELISSTAVKYGAIGIVADDNGTQPATAQNATVHLGTGAAAAEVDVFGYSVHYLASSTGTARGNMLMQRGVNSGTRLSGAIVAPTPGSDNGRIGLYGFA